jgi:hypothetical protein
MKPAESMPNAANRERIAFREGACGIQTLYMTETMQINRITRAATDPRTVSFQAPIDGLY